MKALLTAISILLSISTPAYSYSCSQIREGVAKHGVELVKSKAREKGYTEAYITRMESKCLLDYSGMRGSKSRW